MITSIDEEKHLIKSVIHDKTSQQIKNWRELPQFDRDYLQKLIANMCNNKKLNTLLLRSGGRQGCPLSSLLLFNIVLDVLANATQQEKKRKGIQICKEDTKLSMFADDMIIYIKKKNLKY